MDFPARMDLYEKVAALCSFIFECNDLDKIRKETCILLEKMKLPMPANKDV